MRYYAVLLVPFVWLPAIASAQDTYEQELLDSLAVIESGLFSATNLYCEYGEGTFATYEGLLGVDRGPMLEPVNGLSPARFTDIDTEQGTANLFGTSVSAIRSGHGITFFERTPLGSWAVTTVFATIFNDSGAYVAVTSRHIGTSSGLPPIPSQYHGSCTPY